MASQSSGRESASNSNSANSNNAENSSIENEKLNQRKNTSFKITNILPSRPPSHDPEESGDDDPDDSHTEDISEHFEFKLNLQVGHNSKNFFTSNWSDMCFKTLLTSCHLTYFFFNCQKDEFFNVFLRQIEVTFALKRCWDLVIWQIFLILSKRRIFQCFFTSNWCDIVIWQFFYVKLKWHSL